MDALILQSLGNNVQYTRKQNIIVFFFNRDLVHTKEAKFLKMEIPSSLLPHSR